MATEKQQDLKNQLAKNAGQEKEMSPQAKVSHYLEKHFPSMASVLPEGQNPERMKRIALNVIRSNPKLLECNLPSLMGGVMEASKLGLEPGMMGQCYLIPFKNNKTNSMEAQFVIGYRGLIDLVRRSGQVSTLSAQAVYENDEFTFEYGLEDKLIHKPVLKNRGEVIAYYAIAKMKDGGYNFIVMSREDVEAHKQKHAKSKNYGPWKDEFDAMAKKTALRQLIKYLPISIEYLSHDEKSGVASHNEFAEEKEQIDIDYETGEIIDAAYTESE